MPGKTHPRWFEKCMSQVDSLLPYTIALTLITYITRRKMVVILALRILPSAVRIYHEAVMDARKDKRATCFHLGSITMHTAQKTGRTSCNTGETRKRDQENYGKEEAWPAWTFPRATTRADAPLQRSSPRGWKSRQLFTPPVFSGSCTHAASWAAS